MVSAIKRYQLAPVAPGKPAFDGLAEASTLLSKIRIVPSEHNLAQAHRSAPARKRRIGQLVDILA